MKFIPSRKLTKHLLGFLAFIVLFGLASSRLSAQTEEGEKLFRSYCASCHSPGANQLIGPGLAGVYDKYEREWLYKWIKNSAALIESGDAEAIAIYEEYNKVPMPAQPVTNEDIDKILDYVKAYGEKVPEAATAISVDGAEIAAKKPATSPYIIGAFVIAFLILIIILRKVQHIMKVVDAKVNDKEIPY